jgi:hypothetical protein
MIPHGRRASDAQNNMRNTSFVSEAFAAVYSAPEPEFLGALDGKCSLPLAELLPRSQVLLYHTPWLRDFRPENFERPDEGCCH